MEVAYFNFKRRDPSTLQAPAHQFMREGLKTGKPILMDSFVNCLDLQQVQPDMLDAYRLNIKPLLNGSEHAGAMEIYDEGFNLWIMNGQQAVGIFRYRR